VQELNPIGDFALQEKKKYVMKARVVVVEIARVA